jgi:hypothetical protein
VLLTGITGKYNVTVVAEYFPGDESIEYTSPWAGGFWRTHVGLGPEDEEVRSWETETFKKWRELLKVSDASLLLSTFEYILGFLRSSFDKLHQSCYLSRDGN